MKLSKINLINCDSEARKNIFRRLYNLLILFCGEATEPIDKAKAAEIVAEHSVFYKEDITIFGTPYYDFSDMNFILFSADEELYAFRDGKVYEFDLFDKRSVKTNEQ